MYFGLRARAEHHRLQLQDLQVRKNDGPGGAEYVIWLTERGSKTRTGVNETVSDRPFNPRMYATDGRRCPVAYFKKFLACRPPEMQTPESPLYLAAIKDPKSDDMWFKRQQLGENTLGIFMNVMSKAAGLTGRFTNNSVRGTMISTLRRENVQPLNIIGLSGRKNDGRRLNVI